VLLMPADEPDTLPLSHSPTSQEQQHQGVK